MSGLCPLTSKKSKAYSRQFVVIGPTAVVLG